MFSTSWCAELTDTCLFLISLQLTLPSGKQSTPALTEQTSVRQSTGCAFVKAEQRIKSVTGADKGSNHVNRRELEESTQRSSGYLAI